MNRHHAWPFQTEYLSALFDYNVAPFFQSFVEVRVEPSARRVRLLALRRPRPAAVARSVALGRPERGDRRPRRLRRVGRADAMKSVVSSAGCSVLGAQC